MDRFARWSKGRISLTVEIVDAETTTHDVSGGKRSVGCQKERGSDARSANRTFGQSYWTIYGA